MKRLLDTWRDVSARLQPAEDVRRDQLYLVFSQSAEGLRLSLLVAWIVALMAWPHVSGVVLGGWISLMSGVLVARYFLTRAFRDAHHETDERWIALMVASVAVTGVVWGTTGLFIADTPLHLDILIIVTVAMMTISAVSYLGQYLPAYFTFLVCSTVPMLVIVSPSFDPYTIYAALMYLVFLFAAATTSYRFNRVITERLRLQNETSKLNRKLGEKNRELVNELEQRKIAEAERDRNRQYLDAIFANAPVLMFLRDLDGRYVKVNRHFEETFGVRDEDVHGRGPTEIHSPEMARRIQEQDRAVLTSGRTHIDEEPFRRPGNDGEPGTLLTVKFPIASGEGTVTGLGGVLFDITRQKATENELRLSRERFRDFAEIASDFYWEVDAAMILSFSSSHGPVLSRIPMSELISTRGGTVDGGRIPVDAAWQEYLARRDARKPYEFEASFIRADSSETRIHIKATPLLDDEGRFAGYRGVARDVTTEYRLKRDIAYQASHDPLTGLTNRRRFLEHVAEFVADTRLSGRRHLLFYLDLDRFKFVNDTAGHPAGDALLVEVARTIGACLGREDIFGRIGGDEFGVLVHDCPIQRGEEIAAAIVDSISDMRFQWQGRHYSISTCVGISVIDAGSGDATIIVADADQALYRAKDLGEGRVFVSGRTGQTPQAGVKPKRHTDWLDAFDRSRVQLYAQPIVRLDGKQSPAKWYELLLRLVNSDGVHAPGAFVPYAERAGMSARVDQWVVVRAFEEIAALDGAPGCRFSINLSAASLCDQRVQSAIMEQLQVGAVQTGNICFEVAETSVIRNFDVARGFMERLRAEGCLLALDDFGTGLSSFAHLRRFPVDFVKIDGDFIRELDREPCNPVFIESICSVASTLGIETIGECIESAGIIERLAAIGVCYGQGFALGEPAPLTALATGRSALN